MPPDDPNAGPVEPEPNENVGVEVVFPFVAAPPKGLGLLAFVPVFEPKPTDEAPKLKEKADLFSVFSPVDCVELESGAFVFAAPKPKSGFGVSFVCATVPNGEEPSGFDALPNADAALAKGDCAGAAEDAANSEAVPANDVGLEVPDGFGAPKLKEKPGAGDEADDDPAEVIVL